MNKVNETSGKIVGGKFAKMLAHEAGLINNTVDNDRLSRRKKADSLSRLFNLGILNNVIIEKYHCKTLSNHTRKIDSKFHYARIATNRLKDNRAFVAIEVQHENNWILKKLIPLENVATVKIEPSPTNDNKFDIHVSVMEMDKIPTPESICF